MNIYTIIAGADGTGKSSLRGVLEGINVNLGHIIAPDLISVEIQFPSEINAPRGCTKIRKGRYLLCKSEFGTKTCEQDLKVNENNNDLIKAAKIAVLKIRDCLNKNISFTQETTLSGRTVMTTVK